jgi:hypothetical protein
MKAGHSERAGVKGGREVSELGYMTRGAGGKGYRVEERWASWGT